MLRAPGYPCMFLPPPVQAVEDGPLILDRLLPGQSGRRMSSVLLTGELLIGRAWTRFVRGLGLLGVGLRSVRCAFIEAAPTDVRRQ